MNAIKRITAISVLVTVLWAPLTIGQRADTPDTGCDHSKSMVFDTIYIEPLFFAQSDKKAPEDLDEKEKTGADSSTEKAELESAQTVDGSNKSTNTPPKPLKPFLPSEKIPAGQAVDFPVDI